MFKNNLLVTTKQMSGVIITIIIIDTIEQLCYIQKHVSKTKININ